MKILDRYLLKSFLVTFTTVFVILFFIFVLQVVWLFISELAGKDLDITMIIKFLMFKMPSIIPLVLPLSVLLSSIMTFGSLAENYEFAAIKSSGISLQRAMRIKVYFIIGLSIVAFFFANNVIPFAEYKFINFRRDIAQVKPAMAITEGQFSEVGNYNIKVEKKSGENGKYLDRITIHQKSNLTSGSNTVIKAKKGELVSSKESNILQLVLKDGNYYEDIIPRKFEDRKKLPFAKSIFKKYIINIDLSKLNSSTVDNQKITNTNTMLTVGELRYTLDSLQQNYNKDVVSAAENINQRFSTPSSTLGFAIKNQSPKKLNSSDILATFPNSDKSQILNVAKSTIDAANFSFESVKFDLDEKQKNINMHWIALYDKFVIAYACLLMFFIGAPLGAIIRKGGLGLPIVFAILIFITFHFINTFGKKVAQEDGLTPFLGCWLSSLILTPFAVFLTKTATDDKGFNISFDRFSVLFNRLFPSKEKENTDNEALANEDDISIIEIDYGQTVAENEKLIPLDFDHLSKLRNLYNKYSWATLVTYATLFGISFLFGKPEDTMELLLTISIAAVFLATLIKSQKLLTAIGNTLQKKTEINPITIVIAGFPFYLLFYLYNQKYIREIFKGINKND